MLLSTVFLAIAALSLPTSATPVLPRGDADPPPPLGIDIGNIETVDLVFTSYTDEHCQNDGQAFRTAFGFYMAQNMKSYHLNRSLKKDEVLEFFTGYGTGLSSKYSVDNTMDGHYTEACLQYDSTAGINATTNDDPQNAGSSQGRWSGCHTLHNNEWCANIYEINV